MLFEPNALLIEPRLKNVDFDLSAVMNYEEDCAYISGSVVAGYGNSTSDVDIYVISDKNPELPNGMKFGYYLEDIGYYNEVVVFQRKWLKQKFNDFNLIDFESIKLRLENDKSFLYDLETYYRFCIGIPCINRREFELLHDCYSSLHIINAIYENVFSIRFERLIKNAFLNLTAGLDEHAAVLVNEAFAYALDIITARKAESYFSEKFRFQKVRKVFGDESKEVNVARQLLFIGHDHPLTYINKCLEAFQEFGLSIPSKDYNNYIIKITNYKEIELNHLYLVVDNHEILELDSLNNIVLKLIKDHGPISIQDLIKSVCSHGNTVCKSEIINHIIQLSLLELIEFV